jgi:hypothetical protein
MFPIYTPVQLNIFLIVGPPYCLSLYPLRPTIRFWYLNVISCIYFPKQNRKLWQHANYSIISTFTPVSLFWTPNVISAFFYIETLPVYIFQVQIILRWSTCTNTMFYFKIGLFSGDISQINWFLCKIFNFYPRPAQYFPDCRAPYCSSVYPYRQLSDPGI